MGAILGKIGSWFATVVLGFFLEKILAFIKKYKEIEEARQRLKDELAPKIEKLKNAKTPEEQDAAADDVLKHF